MLVHQFFFFFHVSFCTFGPWCLLQHFLQHSLEAIHFLNLISWSDACLKMNVYLCFLIQIIKIKISSNLKQLHYTHIYTLCLCKNNISVGNIVHVLYKLASVSAHNYLSVDHYSKNYLV